MEINLSNNGNSSLPPQVIGKVQGKLIFKINELVLHGIPSTVFVKLQWWGENINNIKKIGPIKTNKKEAKKSIDPIKVIYDICTNILLFCSYLSQCEPVKADIFTVLSNIKIGTALIKIPQNLYRDKSSQTQAAVIANIINNECSVGEFHVNIEVNLPKLYDDTNHKKIVENKFLSSDEPSQIKLHQVLITNRSKKNLKKKNRKYLTKNNSDDTTSIASKNSTDLEISCRENVLKYLHGEDLTSDLEKQALKSIRNLSPASSLIALADLEHCLTKNTLWESCPSNINTKTNGASIDTQNCSSITKYLDQSTKQKQNVMASNTNPNLIIPDSNAIRMETNALDNIINHVDSIRVTVQTLTLTKAGLRIVLGLESLPLVTISSQVTFFIEYVMPSLAKQQTGSSSRIRICAKSKDGHDVPFNRQSVHKVDLPTIMSNIPNPSILFNVYYRKLSQKQAKHLGQCRITIKEILSAPRLYSTRKCPIITSDKDLKNTDSNCKMTEIVTGENVFSDVIGFGGILAGHLTVKVELGRNLLHFGKHFLESFAANQENISIKSTITNNDFVEDFNTTGIFNGEVLLDQHGEIMNCECKKNCAMFKNKHLIQLQNHCKVCRDYFASNLASMNPNFVFDESNSKAMKRCDIDSRGPYLRVKNSVTKKVIRKQPQILKNSEFSLQHLITKENKKISNNFLTDSDDGKFVNTDLRGGKDIIYDKDQNDKKNLLTKKSFSKRSNYFRKDRGRVADAEADSRNEENYTLLHGLLFVNEARGLEPQILPNAYSLVNRGICPGVSGSSTKHTMCDGKYFQYLEMFPLLCNQALMERCHSGHLIIEIWLKCPGSAQKLVGVASLPLHAFFVAYHDSNMVRYLEKVKLPVISVDGWIPLLSPISGTVSGEIQALLAIGTEKQLKELKISRNLQPDIVQLLEESPNISQQKHHIKTNKKNFKSEKKNPKVLNCSIGVNTSPIVVRQFATSISDINSVFPCLINGSDEINHKSYNTVHTQTTTEVDMPAVLEEPQTSAISSRSSNFIPLKNPKSFGDISTFVSHLIQKAPQDTLLSNFELDQCYGKYAGNSSPKLKQTSELLDELHLALGHVPLQHSYLCDEIVQDQDIQKDKGLENITVNNVQMQEDLSKMEMSIPEIQSNENIDCFKALIEVEQALRLAMVTTSVKKCNKRSKCKSRTKSTEIAPSTYVTFPAITSEGTELMKAPEGPVVATNVVPSTCSPVWKQQFEVSLPSDLLKTDPKQLVFKVWRKSNSATNIDSNPAPISDVLIGFAVVDLSILLSGLPTICGWFNIINIGQSCIGQIKISITPLENLDKFIHTSNCCSDNDTIHSLDSDTRDNLTLMRLTKSKEAMREILEDTKVNLYAKKSSEKNNDNDSGELNLMEAKMDLKVEKINHDVNLNIRNSNNKITENYDLNLVHAQYQTLVLPTQNLSNSCSDNTNHQNAQCAEPNENSNNFNLSVNQNQINENAEDNVVAMNHSIITDILNQNSNKNEINEDTLNSTSLSRVLKRKFIELHEITQRLRSRLLDVTHDDDDEFERDLNTVSDEKAYDIRPEDFVSLAPIALNSPHFDQTIEHEQDFENLANDYQSKLAEKLTPFSKDTNEEEIEFTQKELALSRDILIQKKCNINNLLQKLTLLTNASEKPITPIEKHVKFNSNVELHENDSNNIFHLISGSNCETGFLKSTDNYEESSIESESKSNSFQSKENYETFNHYDENIEHLNFQHSSENYLRNSTTLIHFSNENKNDSLKDYASTPETSFNNPETSDDDHSFGAADLDVQDVITNILKITENCPNKSRITDFQNENDSVNERSIIEEDKKQDHNKTCISNDL